MREYHQRRRRQGCVVILIGLSALLVALYTLSFHVMRSSTGSEKSLSTYRSGEVLPANMSSSFDLSLTVTGPEDLTEATAMALQDTLENSTAAGSVVIVDETASPGVVPLLLVQLSPDRVWSPIFAEATVTVQLFYATDGVAPWPLDETVTMTISPAVKADGVITVIDESWGLISKPAYTDHLAAAIAEAVATALQYDTFAQTR